MLKKYLEHYIKTLCLVRTSERTIEGVNIDIGHFIRYLENRGVEEIKNVTKKTIDDYQTFLYYCKYRRNGQEIKLSTETQIKRLSAIRSFFRCLVKSNLILFNPAADIELPKRGYSLPRNIYNKQDINKIFSACNLKTVYGYRDRVVFEVLYATGIRITELSCLKINDIDFKNEFLKIIEGKGLKDRTVPLTQISCGYLNEYIENVRPHLINGNSKNILFLSRSGKQLDRFSFSKLFKTYRKKIKLEKHLTGHCFRHTMATELLKRGADIRQIQEILGHESLSTTQKYIHILQDDLKRVHSKTHPREKDILKNIRYKGESLE